MRVLVLGASGMAGHVVTTSLRENGYKVNTMSSKNKFDNTTKLVDATNISELDEFLNVSEYDVIVNCIGALIQQSEEQKEKAILLNSFLPHYLENKYKNLGTKIIHLSTDCVFSGENGPYKEDSPYDGQLFYDRSKALGEINNNKDLTFRMSIIGPDMQDKGVGLFNWFYKQTGEIGGYTKAMWNGVTTIELAKAIDEAIKQNITGLYHLVPDANISKYDLLGLFKEYLNKDDVSILKNESVIIDKTLLNTRTDFDFIVSDYRTMINDMKSWIQNHNNLYPHYVEKKEK